VGEGFAFFRWHSLKWEECCTCAHDPAYFFCARLWVEGYRK
jgi:hypothetical protein